MALTSREAWKSGDGATGANGYDEYAIIVQGDPVADNADDPETITLFAIPKFSAVSWAGHPANNFKRDQIAPGVWIVTANYQPATTRRQTYDASFSFSTGGGTQHITCSRRTVQGYGPPGKPPPNCGGTIGNTGDDIAGTEILVPAFDFKITFYMPPSTMAGAFVDLLRTTTTQSNDDPVFADIDGVSLNFDPGELLFVNGDGSKRAGTSDWEFSMNFKSMKNIQNQTIGGITGINAKGWEYIWVRHAPSKDTTAKSLTQTPIGVYVEEVYAAGTLSPLFQPFEASVNAPPWLTPSGGPGGVL